MTHAPDSLLTLDQAAKFIPGADANTLKRMARAGKLTVYKPGKAHLTTHADIQEAIRSCRVVPKVRTCGSIQPAMAPPGTSPTLPLGLSSTDLAEAALDSALARPNKKKSTR